MWSSPLTWTAKWSELAVVAVSNDASPGGPARGDGPPIAVRRVDEWRSF